MAEKESPHETEIMVVLIFIVMGGGAFLIWYFFRIELTEILRVIRSAEMWFGSLLFGDDFVVETQGFGVQTLGVWRDWLPKADVNVIGISEIKVVTQMALAPLKVLFSITLCSLAITSFAFLPKVIKSTCFPL